MNMIRNVRICVGSRNYGCTLLIIFEAGQPRQSRRPSADLRLPATMPWFYCNSCCDSIKKVRCVSLLLERSVYAGIAGADSAVARAAQGGGAPAGLPWGDIYMYRLQQNIRRAERQGTRYYRRSRLGVRGCLAICDCQDSHPASAHPYSTHRAISTAIHDGSSCFVPLQSVSACSTDSSHRRARAESQHVCHRDSEVC